MPEATAFLNVVLSLGLLLSLAVSVVSLVRSGRSQKREVSFGTEHARKEDLRRIDEDLKSIKAGVVRREEVSHLSGEIESVKTDVLRTREHMLSEGRERAKNLYAQIGNLRNEVKVDFVGVHDRINAVLAAVSELRGEFKGGHHD